MKRQFKFPYNFDKRLIDILHTLDPEGKTINCIYMPPFIKDYLTIIRSGEQADYLANMTRKEYESHINHINNLFPGKIQLLLQKDDIFLQGAELEYYMSLNINKFCVGSIKQAKIIKEKNFSSEIIGSITMQVNSENIKENLSEYSLYFDGFVLPFRHSRDLTDIKKLPKNFYYVLLVNAYCNIYCTGKNHWNFRYRKDSNEEVKCPGILGKEKSRKISWKNAARIRPMDLGFFDPYIYIYKLQDRGWPTADLIREYVLYTSDFTDYPNINYEEGIYDTYGT